MRNPLCPEYEDCLSRYAHQDEDFVCAGCTNERTERQDLLGEDQRGILRLLGEIFNVKVKPDEVEEDPLFETTLPNRFFEDADCDEMTPVL